MTPPKPKPPPGYPFEGKHLWEHPELWDGSPLNPANWPDHMKPIDVTEEFRKGKDNATKNKKPTDR